MNLLANNIDWQVNIQLNHNDKVVDDIMGNEYSVLRIKR